MADHRTSIVYAADLRSLRAAVRSNLAMVRAEPRNNMWARFTRRAWAEYRATVRVATRDAANLVAWAA